jgi:DNA sulfur modification protein DndE
MFSQIKTSKRNKEVVSKLTNKLNLGAENVIARIALAYSLEKDIKLDLKDLKDSGGKEYSKGVLFGENIDVYIGLICIKYNFHSSQKDLGTYIKLHLDHGLEMIEQEFEKNGQFHDIDFILKLAS